MSIGTYQRHETEVICPKCKRTFIQKRVTGGPCFPCQQRQRWIDERPQREAIHGAGTSPRRADSDGATLNTITAAYLGRGCFTDGVSIVAFVAPRSRPAWLTEGKDYRLEMELVPYGILYSVQSEVSA
jgi:hypothetical protein